MKILLGLAVALTCTCSLGVQFATAAPDEEGGRVLEKPDALEVAPVQQGYDSIRWGMLKDRVRSRGSRSGTIRL